MQISDLVGQYSRNVANGTEELHGAQSVQKLVSTIGDLSAGSIFEGTINSVRGGKVTLALGNGQTITARLDGKMDLQQGSSMFFQVRANDGQTIAIRPYTELGNVSNPILLNALSAAQVPATDRTLVMVDTMMQEQMSIGRQSILDMAKLVGANPDANVQTIVQMTKLGLPVTEEMAAQFENYLSDRQALVGEMDLAAGHMMELLSDEALSPETAFSLYGKMLDIFMPGAEAADAGVTAAAEQESSAAEAGAGVMAEAVGQKNAATVAEAEAGAPTAAEQGTAAASAVAEEAGAASTAETAGQGAAAEAETGVGVTAELTYGRTAETPGTVGELLSKEQIEHLGKMLRNIPALIGNEEIFAGGEQEEVFVDTLSEEGPEVAKLMAQEEAAQEQPVLNEKLTAEQQKSKQITLFDEKLLDEASVPDYKIIGQVFDTYWIVQFHDSMYIIDQHAAHERVLYERTLKGMKTRDYTSQYISPPIILDLSMQEAELFRRYLDRFTKIGFEIEPFGGDSFAVRAVPDNLFSVAKKELLLEMIDSLSDEISTNMTPEILDEKIASMSCKAAVKGNSRLSRKEVEELLLELLKLDNPYHCPHGRPTIIAMTKRELEKKFKRIV